MSIPDYMITRTVIDEHMRRQFQLTPKPDLPEPRRRQRPERLAGVRRQMSTALHAVANRLEPQPLEPAPRGSR